MHLIRQSVPAATNFLKHTVKVEIPPVPEEQNTDDNIKSVMIEVKEPVG
jgi:hypothetical protein